MDDSGKMVRRLSADLEDVVNREGVLAETAGDALKGADRTIALGTLHLD